MEDSRKEPLLDRIDPRTHFVITLLSSALSFLLGSEAAMLCLLVLLCLWLAMLGQAMRAARFLATYAILWGALYVIRDIPVIGATSIPLVTIYARRVMLPCVAACPLLAISIGRLMAALTRMGLPKVVPLSLAILFRFFPTISQEYTHIRETQKVRGIGTSVLAAVSQPLLLFESIMVPMLMRTAKTADELSASAVVRGVRLEGAMNPYYTVRLTKLDGIVAVAGTALGAAVLVIDKVVF